MGGFEQAIRQSRLAVVDVGDNGKVAYVGRSHLCLNGKVWL
jgi:hypothetical protein